MTQYNFKLTQSASRDIASITHYIAQSNPVAAEKIRQDIMDACALLGTYPHIGQARTDLTHKPVRFWSAHPNYMIVYYAERSPIEIARVYHSARDFARIFH